MAKMLKCAAQNPKRLLIVCFSAMSEVEVKRARDLMVEQQHGRRERNELERQNESPLPRIHSAKRKKDQNEDERVHATSLFSTPPIRRRLYRPNTNEWSILIMSGTV